MTRYRPAPSPASDRQSGSPSGLTGRAAILALLAFLLTLPAVTTRIYASDEAVYYVYLRSLWFDRDVSFENDYQYLADHDLARSPGFRETFLERTTETGRRISFGTIGCAMLWSPFYALADAFVASGGRGPGNEEIPGFSRPYVAAVCYGSALYGFLAICVSAIVAARVIGPSPHQPTWSPAIAAGTIAIGTPLIFYMYVAPAMAHATETLVVALFVLLWLRVRDGWPVTGCAGLAAVAALMVMVREQDIAFVAVPVLDFTWQLAAGIRQARRLPDVRRAGYAALAATVTFAIVFLPQALSYVALNGRLAPSSLILRKMRWTAPHAWQVLGSPEHGYFLWTPIAVLALAGLCWLAGRPDSRDQRRVALCLLAGVAADVYVAGSLDSWIAAGGFGQRRLVSLTPMLVTGLAVLLSRSARRGRLPLALTLALCVWWNAGLMLQFGSGMMDRQRLELRRVTYNNFLVVPRALPGLAYRYVFDRQSFYRREP